MAQPMGFFTDTTICIGCKACEVACKEWNQLPATNGGQNTLSGDSYDNTRRLDGIHWRHVKFVEQFSPDRRQGRWLMMSDVCKHCVKAGCMEVCPTGAIIRTEFDTVVIQSAPATAAATASPRARSASSTSIRCPAPPRSARLLRPAPRRDAAGMLAGVPDHLDHVRPDRRADEEGRGARRPAPQGRGETGAHLYGADEKMLGGLNSFYLLVDKPRCHLPTDPEMPSRNPLFAEHALVGARRGRDRAGEPDHLP
jgi:formate dehydrogenase iron-sulfur subunit